MGDPYLFDFAFGLVGPPDQTQTARTVGRQFASWVAIHSLQAGSKWPPPAPKGEFPGERFSSIRFARFDESERSG
jgi:hypothetical protein